MNIYRVLFSLFPAYLPDRFDKRLRLNVTDGAADLGHDHIRFGMITDRIDKPLDFICDMRNDLHGFPKVFAPSFLMQDIPVHLAGGKVAEPVQIFINKPLIMTQVQIGFRAVFRHEHFTVLVRGHRAGIDIDVRVQFL